MTAPWALLGGVAFLAALGLAALVACRRMKRGGWRPRRSDDLAVASSGVVSGACGEADGSLDASRVADAFRRECETAGRDWPTADLAWIVYSRMLVHLLAQVPAQSVAVVTQGAENGDVLIAHPAQARDDVVADIGRRIPALRHVAATGVVLQQLVARGTLAEVQLPLRHAASCWGMVLLRRIGRDGFTANEIALAGRLSLLAQDHVDRALSAAAERETDAVDAATGAPSREATEHALARGFDAACRSGAPFSVALVEIDGLDAVRRRHGPGAAAHCLREVAGSLCHAVADAGTIGRYDGDGFALVLPGADGAAAREIGERARIGVPFLGLTWNGGSLDITVSVGLSTRRADEPSPQATVARAGAALVAARRAGRNCVRVAPVAFD